MNKGSVPPLTAQLLTNMQKKKKQDLEKELELDMEVIFNKTNSKSCSLSGH
ncbi:MAG: hypothetical protein PHC46_04080 [Clostridia bacterium]|nr:hypothetical protein [Clostridia bacterium]